MTCVLVIEDNPTNMKLAVFLLEKEGYEVKQAIDAEEGLRLARAQYPDLILMDVKLPGMDGLTAARYLKNEALTKNTKIIAFTAHAMTSDREKIESAGCDGYITKPIRYQDFLKIVEVVLGKGDRNNQLPAQHG
ncbi:MAG: response regulator [Gammaproteobacteria bacterium]|nr:response regulator [Gammaproteobacteria bacterium]